MKKTFVLLTSSFFITFYLICKGQDLLQSIPKRYLKKLKEQLAFEGNITNSWLNCQKQTKTIASQELQGFEGALTIANSTGQQELNFFIVPKINKVFISQKGEPLN